MRMIQCKRCGKTLQVSGKIAYCDECRLAIKRESVIRERICPTCGISFMGYPKSKYCRDCQLERNRIKDRDSKRRKTRGESRVIGQEYPCEKCGNLFILTTGSQKYCPECAVSASSEVIRAHKRDYARENMETYRDAKIRRHTDRTICVICGKAFTSDLPTVTCSPECAAEHIRRRQRRYDLARIPAKDRENKEAQIATQAEWVRGIREGLHLTQREAAKIVGVTPVTWSNWERGVSDISVKNRERVERMLEQEAQSEANVKEIFE